MLKTKKFIITLAILAIVIISIISFPLQANAFNFPGLHWNVNTVYYDMSGVSSAWQSAISAAASSWSQAGANFQFVSSSSSTNDLTTGDLDSWVVATSPVYYNQYNLIVEAGIIFNTAHITFHTDGTDYDVQATATHELGHWLMLDHTSDTNTVMYSGYTGLRDLAEDDVNGIIYIYGQ
jgi:predicted Zn-dependent protease